MFFVHGGGGVSGAGDMYDPTPLLREDVIVITTNYRLGTLGFLNFGNDIVSGNMVIRDLLEGLKWSKNNIEFFGGDASRTIAFGQSAGSMLTHALHLTTKSEGLLSGAIAQSGSVPMASTKSDEGRTAAEIALYLNCTDIAIDEAMLDCLQQVSFQDIVIETTPTGEVLTEDDIKYDWTNFLLAQDEYSSDPLFPVNPVLALKNGVFNKVPLMIGKYFFFSFFFHNEPKNLYTKAYTMLQEQQHYRRSQGRSHEYEIITLILSAVCKMDKRFAQKCSSII